MALYLNGTSGISGVDGSAGTPAIQGTDTNTGISFPAADTVAVNTGGSEGLRVDSSRRLLVGTSTARSNVGSTTPLFQAETATTSSSASAALSLINNQGAGGASPAINLGLTRGTAIGGTTKVEATDELGFINFLGSDGTNLIPGARIFCTVDAATGTNDMPGRLVFATTSDGAGSPTERLRIDRTDIIASTRIVPMNDNTYTLGQSGGRWSAVWAANGTIQTSDQRTKIDVTDAALGSNFIKSLRPVSYKWIEGGKRNTGECDQDGNCIYESVPGARTHWGFIAQEVKQAVDDAGVDFGGWVLTDKNDPDSQQALRYDQFIAPLTKALQEALAEIDVLKAKVAALEAA